MRKHTEKLMLLDGLRFITEEEMWIIKVGDIRYSQHDQSVWEQTAASFSQWLSDVRED